MKKTLLLLLTTCAISTAKANTINADATDYTTYLNTLNPGDTLALAPGNYTDRLNLFSIEGTASAPIVIMGSGNTTIFTGNACCNTVSIKQSAHLVLKDFKIDGQNISNIDAIKGEGTTGNWAHHITIENITIVGHGANQQTVGISTKCPAWDWTIRGCTIDGAGTGIYLGNSDGTRPFINGVIENNLIKNTIGYNMEIKHQNDNNRLIAGMTLNGKTIIRHNVFSKANNSSSGGSARPNLLVGNFPDTGDGSNDYYEIYGNFLWQNPSESLFQGTGNINFYNNVCVNYAGGNGVAIQSHNGFKPRAIKVFHNTIICDVNWGVRLMDTDENFQKYISGNAVFSNHSTPIRVVGTGVGTTNQVDNIIDGTANANNYVNNANNNITTLDVYPITGSPLNSTTVASSLFTSFSDYDKDFNLDTKDWQYRGAYSGEGTNNNWQLAIELKDLNDPVFSSFDEKNTPTINAYPNPTQSEVILDIPFSDYTIELFTVNSQLIGSFENKNILDLTALKAGVYFATIKSKNEIQTIKLIKE